MKPHLAFVLALHFCLLPGAFCLAAGEKPNVVILYTDDQGTLDAGCYGSTDLHTPTIDRLARDGQQTV